MLLKPSSIENNPSIARYRTLSASQLSPSSISSTYSIVSHSTTPSPSCSTSSLVLHSTKNSFFKNPRSSKKPEQQQDESRFVMTLMKSPSSSPNTATQRAYNSCNEIGSGLNENESGDNGNSTSNGNNKFFKSKVTAALNHMKYRWAVRMRPNFRNNESPIYLLGRKYNGKDDTSYDDASCSYSEQSYSHFLSDFQQRIYLSYRKQFDPLIGSNSITSDMGWGSSKRNSIEQLKSLAKSHKRPQLYRDIIRLFGDFDSKKCPFSIHRIVEIGDKHGIRPGDWFGPVSVAHALKQAVQSSVELKQIPDNLRVYVSQDAIIYRQDIIDLCCAPSAVEKAKNLLYPTLRDLTTTSTSTVGEKWNFSLLLLVPLRLGLNELDLIYEPYLKEALKLSQTVGIIGGSPKHAVYIIGFQDDNFIDLDPHYSQSTVNVTDDTFDLSSFFCSSPKKLTAKKMDPSCTLGFYCRDRNDFDQFCSEWMHLSDSSSSNYRRATFTSGTNNNPSSCPIFRIMDGTFKDSHLSFSVEYPQEEENILRVTKLNQPTKKNKHSHSIANSSNQNNTNNNNSKQCYTDYDGTHNRLHSLSDDYVFL
ncbi:unnamed protein product [Didymodactylos carnosus]|uniref:Cysteine protease n=1 Tax=Didymodactylos carnosus TaxID=1234261 RepID=A0A814GWN9_9BILA|nr:unnamed protein product [Didymodactylos carnosus]CAF1001745.1 unnamed protein product [Didymodactylos carnosus]CAF3566516.1 unnamed protein product [Didymodactylos carnosus]CAF3773126.1 unnamed protein product [Didymodactylos carnosus]